MDEIRKAGSSEDCQNNQPKHHWPQGSVTLLSIICCLYGGLRIGYAFDTIFGVDPGPQICEFTIILMLFQRFSTEAKLDSAVYRMGVRISGIGVGLLMYETGVVGLSDIAYATLHRWVGAPHFRAWMILIGTVFAVSVVIGGTIHAFRPRTVLYDVDLRKEEEKNAPDAQEPRKYRIVQLSDLHVGAVIGERAVRRICDRTKALQPDLVVYTGDQFNHGYVNECRDEDAVAQILSELSPRDGCWAILGNHDPEPDDPELIEFYKDAHITPLDNSVAVLDGFNLVGRTGLVNNRDIRVPLMKLLQQADLDKPVIVLDHDPMGIPQAADCQAGLVLAGHSHQGQFFPNNLFVGRSFPQGYFHGITRTMDTISIVSAGAGVFQVPLRVGTDSEIVVVDLLL